MRRQTESMRPALPALPLLLLAPPAFAAPDGAAADMLMPIAWAALGAGALVASAWLAWRLRRLRARLDDLAARNARLGAANAKLRETADRAEAKSRMLDGVMAAMSDGVAVVDGQFRLAGWNARFPEVAGVPRRGLRIGMPFVEVVRLQAEAGEFGLVDPEAETGRRMALLHEGKLLERWQRERPDGSRIELRRAPLPGGGFVTLYTPVANPAVPPPPELAKAFQAEWAARLPRLTAAAADSDIAGVRAAAHALRGIAANAGWTGAATTLAALEAAAAGGDMPEVRALAGMLTADQPW